GSCFPKDVLALSKLAASLDYPLPIVNAAIKTNAHTRERVVRRLEKALGSCAGRRIAVLGLAFKDNTDDTRESAAVAIIRDLHQKGAAVRAYDPVAKVTPEQVGHALHHAASPYGAAEGAEATVIATEWDEFRNLDLARLKNAMQGSVLLDGRNLLKPEEALRHGFTYIRVGRK
ncbi:UDP-glucose 6-dehydrogenase, partial [Patescibacteria group bacterium]|nr:UDP-glucose 6-dehydrogenase [Patescibacteria group bacterium]